MSTRITAISGACLAIAAVLFAAEARAQVFYFGGEAGWTSIENERGSITRLPAIHERWDDGFNAGARVGYEMGPWRFEEEYNYRENDLNRWAVGALRTPGARGGRHAHAIMTNLIYDFNFGWPVTPHIGAGIGAVDISETVRLPRLGRIIRDDDWQFGYQGIAGVRYNLTPRLAVDLDYRYLATTDPSFRVRAIPGARLRSGYHTHNLLASLTYRFGPPPLPVVPPPLPPAPPPVTQRVFIIFFDWDRATITPEGMQIVQQAADAYKAGGRVQIQVTGYTDRSGSPGYNQRLSERRATNVADALANLGVPHEDMIVAGRGENDNRVPTAPGVREPQNRRVEIVFP